MSPSRCRASRSSNSAQCGALFLDTCIEPWPGGYTDPSLSPSLRSNYALRERALALRRKLGPGPAALLTHGANPGLVSHLVKEALVNVAGATGASARRPRTRSEWATLAQTLGVRVIHVAERDTQVSARPKRRGEFVNTWSIDGFVGEGSQPAELGWGSHERHFPADGQRHDFGAGAAIFPRAPGRGDLGAELDPARRALSRLPHHHSEAISVADYLTVSEGARGGQARYRPTVHYAYHPCDGAVLSLHEFAGKNWRRQEETRLIMGEITGGMDELGVLLMGHAKGRFTGSARASTIDQARGLADYNNATSLQVTAAVLAGVV